ncbi:Oidioi.mRNA.OKI2018_I69.chr1.g488.t1.cds [Oikopleura dioica]|uniref:Oidioi.mRNA.OKI2018_I69.chr1.g488.t1.cds n=1 Tax=Oikopleura dioica TaxID=34765 RepID=A0ABN7SNW1_OIKDI|nr:Oidioi.mRNA.OKI2018_I69.chr1.g488.t1.cds [Oikopleura dioica]
MSTGARTICSHHNCKQCHSITYDLGNENNKDLSKKCKLLLDARFCCSGYFLNDGTIMASTNCWNMEGCLCSSYLKKENVYERNITSDFENSMQKINFEQLEFCGAGYQLIQYDLLIYLCSVIGFVCFVTFLSIRTTVGISDIDNTRDQKLKSTTENIVEE